MTSILVYFELTSRWTSDDQRADIYGELMIHFGRNKSWRFSCYKLAPIHDIAKTLLLVVKYLHNCGLEPVGMAVGRWSPTTFGIGGLPVEQRRGRGRGGSFGEGSAPEWNETFVFTISGDVEEITLKIMDKNTFSSDDFVGEATISLHEVLREGEVSARSYNVVKDEEYCGEIKLGLTFTSGSGSHRGSRDEEYGGRRKSRHDFGGSDEEDYGGCRKSRHDSGGSEEEEKYGGRRKSRHDSGGSEEKEYGGRRKSHHH
ncbi:Elicitor-responsive protein 3 [Capsicum annuum]|nr:Elicitor-responsive protein 3 [Capsicum annuum]